METNGAKNDLTPSIGKSLLGGNELSGWTVAIAPLLGLAVSAIVASQAGESAAVTAGWVTYFLVNCAVVWWDQRVLKKLDAPLPAWGWGVFLMPVYLWQRQRRLGRIQITTLVWVLAFLLSILLESTVLHAASGALQLDTGALQQQIAQDIQQKTSQTVTVNCPTETLHQGLQFKCLITAADGTTAFADVTVQNDSGDVVWQVEGS